MKNDVLRIFRILRRQEEMLVEITLQTYWATRNATKAHNTPSPRTAFELCFTADI